MKLLVVINNTWEIQTHYEHTGNTIATKRRTVEIELNPEQEEKLKLRYFNKYKLEEIESISILNE